MTILAPTRTERPRPAYRPYRATVAEVGRLSPHFTRVTFRCDDFEHFGTECLDQRIKLLFPWPTAASPISGSTMRKRTWPATGTSAGADCPSTGGTRSARTPCGRSTPSCRLDIDFVAHGDGGPAARWLLSARPGDQLVVVGPDARSPHRGVGIDWRPGDARELLLAGDETAAPAIASILEALPADRRARAFIEVPSHEDALDLRLPDQASVTWLAAAMTRSPARRCSRG